ERAAAETSRLLADETTSFGEGVAALDRLDFGLGESLVLDHRLALADLAVADAPSWLRRVKAKRVRAKVRRAMRKSPAGSDQIGEEATEARGQLLDQALTLLAIASEHRVG